MPKPKQSSKKSNARAMKDLPAPKRSKVKGGSTQFNPKEFTIEQPVPWKK